MIFLNKMFWDDYKINQTKKAAKAKKWVRDCVKYWETKIDESDLGTDFSEALTNCWRCGHLRLLQKCHIIPKSLGGNDKPENIIPLCAQCHDEMPDVRDSKEVFDWIKNNHGTMYQTFWGERALKIADCDFEKALGATKNPNQKIKFFMAKFKEYLNQHTSCHFGQCSGGSRIKPSTIAWAIKKSFADVFGNALILLAFVV